MCQADLQVFNRRERGGAYWYTGGWNIPALVSWAAGCIIGLLSVQTPLYMGPLADIAGGVDMSFLGSFVIAGTLYLILDMVPDMRGLQVLRARPVRGTVQR